MRGDGEERRSTQEIKEESRMSTQTKPLPLGIVTLSGYSSFCTIPNIPRGEMRLARFGSKWLAHSNFKVASQDESNEDLARHHEENQSSTMRQFHFV